MLSTHDRRDQTCQDLTVREQFTRETSRVIRRLSTLSVDRLTRPDDEDVTPAVRAHRAVQGLADLAADSCFRPRRVVPILAPHAVADQVAVTCGDLLHEGDDRALSTGLAMMTELRRAV